MKTSTAALHTYKQPPLILASASPSRSSLLEKMGLHFTQQPMDIDETPASQELPLAYVTRIAKEKGQAVPSRAAYVLSADTIVAVGRRILRKAVTEEEACAQMKILSGRRHRVITAVALRLPNGQQRVRVAQTHVAFKALESLEIEAFLATKDWENVAVYRIEGMAACFIRRINGLPSTVQGLPVYPVYQLLRGQGFVISHSH